MRIGHVTLARRVSGAQGLLGMLALACLAVVFVRVAERWRVTPSAASHRIVVLGQRVSYPAANLAAIVDRGPRSARRAVVARTARPA